MKHSISTTLSFGEAARLLKVSEATLRERIAGGTLCSYGFDDTCERWYPLSRECIERFFAGIGSSIKPEFVTKVFDDGKDVFIPDEHPGYSWCDIRLSKEEIAAIVPPPFVVRDRSFTAITLGDDEFVFNEGQARIVRMFYDRARAGNWEPIPQQDIFLKVGHHYGDPRIEKVFRLRGHRHPALDKLILRSGRGLYRIARFATDS